MDGSLKEKLRALDCGPFSISVVKSPWNPVVDLPEFNREAKNAMLSMIRQSKNQGAPRCLVIPAQPGFGKTHILSWLRNDLEHQKNNKECALFVYVPPYTFEESFPSFLIKNTFSSFLKSESTQKKAKKRIRSLFSDKMTFREKTIDWIRNRFPKIFPPSEKFNKKHIRSNLLNAYRVLSRKYDEPLDKETVIAIGTYFWGDEQEKDSVKDWFYGQTSREERKISGMNFDPPAGIERTKKILRTLSAILEKPIFPICLCFDQMEDTYDCAESMNDGFKSLKKMFQDWRAIYDLPCVCSVFLWQNSIWRTLSQDDDRVIESHIRDRMVEIPPIYLKQLTMEHAEALVSLLFRDFLDKNQIEYSAYTASMLFTKQDIIDMCNEKGGFPRDFLQMAQGRYQEWLNRDGDNKLHDIKKEDTTQQDKETLPKKDGDEIKPTPVNPPGNDIPTEGTGTSAVSTTDPPTPIPIPHFLPIIPLCMKKNFYKYVDESKMRQIRKSKKLIQSDVARKLKYNASTICLAEKGKRGADELYLKMAEFYACNIKEFVRDGFLHHFDKDHKCDIK